MKPKFLILILLSIGMPLAQAADRVVSKKIEHFIFEIPQGLGVKNISPPFSDFDLLEISELEDGGARMVMYFGNFPQFPSFRWITPPIVEAGQERTREDYPYRVEDGAIEGLLSFTGLTYKGYPGTPYGKIHYYSKGANKRQAERFLKIIGALKVNEPNIE